MRVLLFLIMSIFVSVAVAACGLSQSVSSEVPDLPTAPPPLTPRIQPTVALTTPNPILPQEPLLIVSPIPFNIPQYDRGDWRHWVDADFDCQNARHEVLIAESLNPVSYKDESKCTVGWGSWLAPFTRTVVVDASALDVDHMVPLANAHRSGGWAWDPEKKESYANDLSYSGHLIAVTRSANRSKGADGPEDWLPPDHSYYCKYATDWVTVKLNWSLTVTQEEREALDELLDTCPERPTIYFVSLAPAALIPTPAALPSEIANEGLRFDPSGPDRNCGDFDTQAEAQTFFIAAGWPPLDPHELDGDNDGQACEARP